MHSLEDIGTWAKGKKQDPQGSSSSASLTPYGDKPELLPQDVHVYLRSQTHQRQVRRVVHRFLDKLLWLPYSKRHAIYEGAVRPKLSQGTTSPASGVPLTPLVEADVQNQVHNLMMPFHLPQTTGLRELLFTLNRHFDTVFGNQVANMSCSPYQLSSAAQVSASPYQMMYKETTWKSASVPIPRRNDLLEMQQARLSSAGSSPDSVVCAHMSFLAETKVALVKKRLKELSESHADRTPVSTIQAAYIQQRVQQPGVPGVKLPELKPGEHHQGLPQDATCKMTGDSTMQMLRQALHLLRYLRIREFRQRTLSALNLLESVERLLTFDSHQDLYAEPLDLSALAATPPNLMCGLEIMQRVVAGHAVQSNSDEHDASPGAALSLPVAGFSGKRWWDLIGLFRQRRGQVMCDLLAQKNVHMKPTAPKQQPNLAAPGNSVDGQQAEAKHNGPELPSPSLSAGIPHEILTYFANPFQHIPEDTARAPLPTGSDNTPSTESAPTAAMLHALGAHIDSFSMNEDKEIAVTDVLGNRVLYSSTLTQLQRLESELSVIASHYIKQFYKKCTDELQTDIDRFAILEDLYECEAWFQHSKVRVILHLLEAYMHSGEKGSRQQLMQSIY